jgi:2-dehydropantoate 2-reductase
MQPVGSYTVVGAGGIGCAIGYFLRAAGASVLFVDSDADKVAWGRRYGLAVDQLPPLPADFVRFQDWTSDAGETVVLCTKCYDNSAVLGRLPAETNLIPVQNGFDPSLDSRGEYVEGIASFVSECMPGRTHTRITRRGDLHLGVHASNSSPPSLKTGKAVAALAAALGRSGCFRVQVVADILPFKHSKLMYNAAIGPLAAAAGLDNGQLLSLKSVRCLFFALLRENFAILDGARVPLGKIGPFHPRTVNQILRYSPVARGLSWAFYPSLRGTYCSMHADLPKGKTEIDFYNRYLIELARERHCPLNRGIYDLVKSMETNHLRPSIDALTPLLKFVA